MRYEVAETIPCRLPEVCSTEAEARVRLFEIVVCFKALYAYFSPPRNLETHVKLG